MSYTATIQIQPFPNKKRLDTKRESLYTCIRYASNLMKFKTDIRKHNRTIPNDDLLQFTPPLPPHYTYNEKSSHYYYDQEEQQEETMTLYDEKEQDLTTKDCYHSRRESQLALPSRTRYTPINIIHQLDNNEDEEEEEDEYDDDEEFDEEEEEEEEDHLDHYFLQEEDPLTCALQKLSGITFPTTRTKKSSTAVLITLSPCALAAANAARQKRQKIRLTH